MWNPRAGGEKILEPSMGVGNFGSPPAWAGKSLFCFTAAVPIQDHPRMGEEKNIVRKASLDPDGSSPRRRGKGRSVGVVGE